MPFTPSHAVVALPFLRTPLVPAAIAVGSMTPDLPLFVRTGLPLYAVTHDVAALALTAVLALALLLVWRGVLRPAAGELCPRWLAMRLPAAWSAGPRASVRQAFASRTGTGTGTVTVASVVLLAISLALGVLSHIAWDLFTHEGRAGLDVVPVLAEQWGPLPGYKWAQHGSSALGLLILAVWAAAWLRRAAPHPVTHTLPALVRRAWWASLPVALVVAWLVGLAVYGPLTGEWTAQHLAYRVLPPAVGAWGAATLVLAVVVSAGRSRHARDAG